MAFFPKARTGAERGDVDPLFRDAEQRARGFSLFPEVDDAHVGAGDGRIEGLVSPRRVSQTLRRLASLEVDEYIRRTVAPTEDPGRVGARAVLSATSWERSDEQRSGPLLSAVFAARVDGRYRQFGVIAQERSVRNGAWMPEHHEMAVGVIRSFAARALPVVALMDTPGADAGEQANRGNQAHSISRLIAEMAQLHAPTVGIVLGAGYSGGAIPLATTNVLLAVRDGVFNTIQPRGLANIVRRYDLSWEECAKAVGVSAYELHDQGYLDGVIDFVPGEGGDRLACFEAAVTSSIAVVEQRAKLFVRDEPSVFEHYRRNTRRYVDPSRSLSVLEEVAPLSRLHSPAEQANVFGVAFRYLRYLGLRRRLTSTTISAYGRLAAAESPAGAAKARREKQRRASFQRWLENPLAVRYDDVLSRTYKRFAAARAALHTDRGRLASFLLGSREYHFNRARAELLLEYGFHLYNQWKDAAEGNFRRLLDEMGAVIRDGGQGAARAPTASLPDAADLTVLDVILEPQVAHLFRRECENFICFDRLYDHIFLHLRSIAAEARERNVISRESAHLLLRHSLNAAMKELTAGLAGDESAEAEARLRRQFRSWLRHFSRHPRRGRLLKSVAEWKRLQMPRISEPLFGLVTFLFERLLPNFYEDEQGIRAYDGRITPRNIGIRDFWNRLDAAYRDMLLEDVLVEQKRNTPRRPQAILDRFFHDVQEIEADRMTADPVGFPGFRVSIERALKQGVVPCGTVAALARINIPGSRAERGKRSAEGNRVGVLVSNLAFQAGSFDMASAEKFCKLLLRCAEERLPVVCFVSSGGMLTKEGAGALFSMSIVNDRITRFIRDNDLPLICFGFGDCTGGAQASLVTHPLVKTYYFSGTNMPFAGQIVVPSHLPLSSTLSNYLSGVEGAMQGLVQHPFGDELDDQLRQVDSQIPVPEDTVEAVLHRLVQEERRVEFLSVRRGRRQAAKGTAEPPPAAEPSTVRRVLIHARGCTAVKLVRVAQRTGVDVVLVQSDPDVESPAATMLRERDTLVCIGGSTPDESYLNALSVIRVAEQERVDALHPGIGFLSESASFADLCRNHGLNFIGPTGDAMRRMGNKSNAIQTAVQVGVPVVPGSEGILADADTALSVAESIGFPVMLKAVHGGGGKGIRRVDAAADFREAFAQIRAEARSAFGNPDCYLEKCVVSLRHVEVQVLCDRHGTVQVLGLRDCSVQRNNQKLVEESSSTALPPALREESFRHAAAIAREIGYVGAGTVEFIFDLERQRLYFMEMNTRLQVEHPVTEAVTGVDIVKAQFDIAGGARLGEARPEGPAEEDGYAMEVRINAERASASADGIDLLPSPGAVSRSDFPRRDDIDVLATIDTGAVVSPYYDSLVAQVVCHGRDRQDTIDRLLSYLDDVVIEGVCTNLPLLRRVLADDQFRSGDYDTRFLADFLDRTSGDDLVREVQRAAGVATGADRADIEIEGSNELKVLAPSGGLFYAAASPNDPPFAQVGGRVDRDVTLCLIEAMKLFRPVSLASIDPGADLFPGNGSYEVMRVNASDGQVVNQGDLLFVLRPAG